MSGQKNARGGERQGGVDTAKEEVKRVEEEMPKGIRKPPPTKFPLTMRVGDVSVQVKAPPQRKQPPLAEGVWESASSGFDAWRLTD